MSETMGTLSFEKILLLCLNDYETKGKIFEIEKKYFYQNISNLEMNLMNEYLRVPIGPAAGPHTQLSQNIISAYLLGSRYFELKTVQIIAGKQMQEIIEKPCIDARNVGYNVEWSTELTIEEAKKEYIKASVLLQVLAIELELSNIKDFIFNISVGYDLKGIKSKNISNFIDDLKEAKDNETFKECLHVLEQNRNRFKRFQREDIVNISSNITNTVTLSTMHGCKPEEIIEIGSHLIVDKKINTYIKCNPTLLGYEKVRAILDQLGYKEVTLRREDFDNDLQYDNAVEIITTLQKLGSENGVTVGIKLVNTLPVYNARNVLPGESMYLSGKPLYPIALGVADKFAQSFHGDIPISFSGGIDKNNILNVLKTGIVPVTYSTILLKPRGFINIKDLISKIKETSNSIDRLDVNAIKALAASAISDPNYKNKGDGRILEDTLPTYDCFKVNCGICVDVCPNRANIKLYDERFGSAYQIVHIESRCNECDNCHTFCTRGGFPYFKKVTLFETQEEFKHSDNAGILKIGEHKFQLRDETGHEYIYDYSNNESNEKKKKIERILDTLLRDYPYLIESKGE
jgi:putative selenate reductase